MGMAELLTNAGRLQLRALLCFLVTFPQLSVLCTRSIAQEAPDWSEPFPPFKIADNLYYVGTRGLASYLISSKSGHILINSNLESTVPLIRKSVEKLGFKFGEVKILLISHAHWDHCAGSAEIKKLTGAKYMVMEQDVPVIESGGKKDFRYGDSTETYFPATKVDRILHDRDKVTLGESTVVAHLTAGHTKGCTTWKMSTTLGGKKVEAVIIGSPNVNPGYVLAGNSSYPNIALDYERTFRVLKSLRCDLFLGAHGSYFGMEAKYARLLKGEAAALVDPAGYLKYVTEKEQEFRTKKAKK